MIAKHPLSAWPERRPERTESERVAIAEQYAAHLPKCRSSVSVDSRDLDAIRAAFIRRFDETLPRTETLMAVAHVGYRMALRDALAAAAREGGDVQQAPAESPQSGPEGVTPNPFPLPPPSGEHPNDPS